MFSTDCPCSFGREDNSAFVIICKLLNTGNKVFDGVGFVLLFEFGSGVSNYDHVVWIDKVEDHDQGSYRANHFTIVAKAANPDFRILWHWNLFANRFFKGPDVVKIG